jgi:hypothetical protein
MATYEGRLTQCYTDGLEGNGPFVCRRGRYYGGVKFFGDRWTAFDERDVDMSRLERGVELGHLEIRKASGGKGPREKEAEPVKKATSGKGRGRGSSKTRGKQ